MRVGELLNQVDELRPNGYSNSMKIKWLNDIEAEIVENIIKRAGDGQEREYKPYIEGDDMAELVAPERYSSVYLFYILAQLDFHDDETERYQNNRVMFNNEYAELAAYYRREHMPSCGAVIHF